MGAEELKGQALDEALAAEGLSKSGTVDEKRTRLADHLSAKRDDPTRCGGYVLTNEGWVLAKPDDEN